MAERVANQADARMTADLVALAKAMAYARGARVLASIGRNDRLYEMAAAQHDAAEAAFLAAVTARQERITKLEAALEPLSRQKLRSGVSGAAFIEVDCDEIRRAQAALSDEARSDGGPEDDGNHAYPAVTHRR
jgi:hypothetical protein